MAQARKQYARHTKTYKATLIFEVEVAAVNAAQALRCLRRMTLIPHGHCGSYSVGEHQSCSYFFKSFSDPPVIKMAMLGGEGK